MKYVRNTLNLKLMVGLGYMSFREKNPGLAIRWMRNYHISFGRMARMVLIYLPSIEYAGTDRYPDDPNGFFQSWRVEALTDTMLNRQREVCDSLDMVAYPKLWVFSAKGTGKTTFGCDWDSLTSQLSVDVATIGVGKQSLSLKRSPITWSDAVAPKYMLISICGSPVILDSQDGTRT